MDLSILGPLAALFGGCCSSVLTLEGIIATQNSGIGSILTFCQFLVVTVEGLFLFVDVKRGFPFFKSRSISLRVYIVAVLLYYVSSVTNNSVFDYGITVPLHIVFRSSGTVITMIISWLFAGKSYTKIQIFSAFLLTLGAIITSIFKDTDCNWTSIRVLAMPNGSSQPPRANFLIGIGLITVSSIASSTLSIYTEWAYRKYGNHWRENLFYTHALSLPLFLTQYRKLFQEYSALKSSEQKLTLTISTISINLNKEILLIANIFTQQVCIKSVNLFASKTNALTLSVTLLFRKFLSLLLSFYIFGSDLSLTCYVGIVLVFLGASLYAISPASPNTIKDKTALKKDT